MTKRYDSFEEPKQPDAPKAKKPSKGSRRKVSVSAQEALDRIQQNPSESNYAAVIAGFAERGIPDEDIHPKENVFTFNAWKAKGRRVKKGEHAIKILTWVPVNSKKSDGDEVKITKLRPSRCALFHISQTQAIDTPVAVANELATYDIVPVSRNIQPPTGDLPSWLQ
jgi:hypothetical protein